MKSIIFLRVLNLVRFPGEAELVSSMKGTGDKMDSAVSQDMDL